MHVKRNALAWSNVESVDAGALRLVDHIDGAERLGSPPRNHTMRPRARARAKERQSPEARPAW